LPPPVESVGAGLLTVSVGAGAGAVSVSVGIGAGAGLVSVGVGSPNGPPDGGGGVALQVGEADDEALGVSLGTGSSVGSVDGVSSTAAGMMIELVTVGMGGGMMIVAPAVGDALDDAEDEALGVSHGISNGPPVGEALGDPLAESLGAAPHGSGVSAAVRTRSAPAGCAPATVCCSTPAVSTARKLAAPTTIGRRRLLLLAGIG
jgi:hypothetical protein